MASVVRACFYAPPDEVILSADLSGVEARANAWAANDTEALDVFIAGKDPYIRIASRIFNVDPKNCTKKNPGNVNKDQRGLGKRVELGCGYDIRAVKFVDTVIKYGGDWNDVPIDPAIEWPRAVKQAARHKRPDYQIPWIAKSLVCVDAYRDAHAPIVRFWDDLEAAAVSAAQGVPCRAGPTRSEE